MLFLEVNLEYMTTVPDQEQRWIQPHISLSASPKKLPLLLRGKKQFMQHKG